MDITEITRNDVMLDLDVREHRALSKAFCMLMASLEPHEIKLSLGWNADKAYEFGYSVYCEEVIARLDGVTWLDASGCRGRLAVNRGSRPAVTVSFSDAGSSWRLDAQQARFLGRCMDVARRMEAAGTLVESREELVYDLVA